MRDTTFMLLLFLLTIIGFHPCSGCIQSERDGLLKFKQKILKFKQNDPSNRLASWAENGDCCKWYGVVCHNLTGHVLQLQLGLPDYDYSFVTDSGGEVSESLLDLKHLEYLDLSNNYFGESPSPEFLGSIRSLKHLDLSGAVFGGLIPSQLGNLSNLQYLNLYNNGPYEIYVENLQWLSSLLSLKFLELGHTNLNQASDWLNVINTLPSLLELHFSGCELTNVSSIPKVNFSSLSVLDFSANGLLLEPVLDFVQNLTSLKELDLSDNLLNSSIPNWLCGFSQLELLQLGSTELQGTIPTDFGNLTSLVTLNLGGNNLVGKIPKSFKNLCNLRSISFWGNKIGQETNEIFEILLPCISNVLEELDLDECGLSGYIPNHLEKFQNLAFLFLQNNSITGPIPISIGNLISIDLLDLSMNNLNGTLPVGFGGLTTLEKVDLSQNALNGDVSEIHFENLTNLIYFHASENKFRLKVGSDWKPPRDLINMDLVGWSIGPQFPHWVQSLNQLKHLNLANSGIASPTPAWFWNVSSAFLYLNISHNQIRGVIPDKPSSFGIRVGEIYYAGQIVDLSSNNFEGPLPYMFSDMQGLFLSDNSFTGPLSKFLCHKMANGRSLKVLDIGNNQLSGEIPDCWMNWGSLKFIKLNNNKLSGKIPLSIGALTRLRSLHLRNNSISGEIPLSLRNCTNLATVDFSQNELVRNIPSWFGETFQKMTFLSLSRNKFDGHVPEELCGMISLRILDLSDNNLFGAIPKCLYHLSEMVSENDSKKFETYPYAFPFSTYGWPFVDSMPLVTKGKMNTYDRILKFVRALDFSKNKLSGQIPEEITSLEKLIFLNLSHNLLSGRIPTNIGDMQSLEVLDFSQNKLFGEIPQSLAKMAFLSMLNLSFNNFSGRIPLSTQIEGFPPSSFTGNEELCGPPLSKTCSGDGEAPGNASTERGDDGSGHEINWLYVSMPLGFVVGFWATFGPLVLNRRWRGIYFQFLENLWDKIWLWWHLM